MGDKVYEVTFRRETRRAEANTAYEAWLKTFPGTGYEEVHIVERGRVLDVAAAAHEVETVCLPPPRRDRDAAIALGALDSVRKGRRARELGLRIASRLRRELADQAFFAKTFRSRFNLEVWTELFQCADDLAQDQS